MAGVQREEVGSRQMRLKIKMSQSEQDLGGFPSRRFHSHHNRKMMKCFKNGDDMVRSIVFKSLWLQYKKYIK